MLLTSCGVTYPRPLRKAYALAASVSAMVARGEAPSVADLRAFCDGRLASYKHPRRVQAVDAIPRTPATNQVQRRLLVERITTQAF